MNKLNSFSLLLVLFFSKLSFAVDWSSLGQKELEENYLVAEQRAQVMQDYYILLYGKEKTKSDFEIKKTAWDIGFRLHNIESYISKYLNLNAFKNEPLLAEKCVKLWTTPVEVLRLSVNYFKDWNQMSPKSTETVFRKLQVDLLLNYINVALLGQFSLNEELGKTLFGNVGIACEFKYRNEILSQLIQLQQEMSELYISAHGVKGLRNLNEDMVKAAEAAVKHYQRQLHLVFPKLLISTALPIFAQLKFMILIGQSSSLLAKFSYLGINAGLGGYTAYSLIDNLHLDNSNQLLRLNSMDFVQLKDAFVIGDQDKFLDLIDFHREINNNVEQALLKANFEYNQKYTFIKRGLQKHKTEEQYLNYLKRIKKEIESELKSR